jgi:hypothetical protein
LANEQICIILKEIRNEINLDKYLSTNIDSRLYNLKKYVELGVGICQKGKNKGKNDEQASNDYWLVIINSIYSFQMEFLKEFENNKNNYKTNDYNKINNALDEAFELLLLKMSDHIKLEIIVNEMFKKCGEAGFEKFKSITSLMFIGYKMNENICKLSKKLTELETEKKLNEFIFEFNKGQLYSIEKCELCKKSFDVDSYLIIIRYFKCNHCFHQICFMLGEYDIEICPICEKQKIDLTKYKLNKKNEVIDINEKKENKIIEIKSDDIKRLEKKIEAKRKMNMRRQKISQLRRIRKIKEDFKIIFDKEFLN